MESPLAYVLLLVVVVLLAAVPLTVLDRIRARRTRKIEAAGWAAALKMAEAAPELGYQLRLEIGGLRSSELERVFVLITEVMASVGAVDTATLKGLVAQARREHDAANTPDAEATPAD